MVGHGAVFGLYSVLAVVGALLPLSAFLPWLAEHGFDLRALAIELFSTRIGAFFGWDVIVSALVLIVLILVEGRRAGVRHRWLPVAATFGIGVSCGLPLFLAMRERTLRAA